MLGEQPSASTVRMMVRYESDSEANCERPTFGTFVKSVWEA
jgi:hypothetical protein